MLALPAALLYFFAALLYRAQGSLLPPTGKSQSLLLAHGIFLLALFSHAGALIAISIQAGHLALGIGHSLSLLGATMALLFLLANLSRSLLSMGTVIALGAGVSALLGQVLPDTGSSPALGHGILAHIIFSVLAYAVLAFATLQALLLAAQHSRLRRHDVRLLSALPPIEAMEQLLFQLVGAGFLLLTLSLVSGFLFLDNLFAQHLVHKTILSIAAWATFGTLLWGHWQLGWRGRRAVHWALGGFTLLLLAYLGSKVVLELILHRV
ncbi:MAG: cytochrome c biogenesis protein CcsA [Gammaproteobacteria bacterium]|nr:cytochrome c biogenesis protein CcsA [Gammaproteobacteria bacterium]